jgi:polyphosphate kinase 2 (PPK2 family)
MSPRICRVVALSAPSDREKTQWYFQRYGARRGLPPNPLPPPAACLGH